jgi:hypothetical protein
MIALALPSARPAEVAASAARLREQSLSVISPQLNRTLTLAEIKNEF